MIDLLLRFLIGGMAVSCFAALSDVMRPKSFAGLFGGAPSIALATLALTVKTQGAGFADREALAMMLGAFALTTYSLAVCFLLQRRHWHSMPAVLLSMAIWFAVAFGVALVTGLL